MTLTSNKYRLAVALTIFGAAFALGNRAKAQDSDAVQKVVELNKKALASFAELNMDEAVNLLKQALELCRTAQLENHPAAARTHVHLGAVYVAGLKKRDQGIEEFKQALRIDPNIKITKSLINPEVQSAFAEASMDVSEGAEGVSSAPPAAPAAPVEPTPAQPAEPAAAEGTIVHTPIAQSPAGQPVYVRAQVPASVGAERIVLAYRPDGATNFAIREMDPVDNSDWYQGQIPPEATSGASVAYYIVAQNGQGQVLEQNGTAAQPHVVSLGGEGASTASGEGTGEPTPEVGDQGGEAGAGPSLWIALAAGSGFGYHSGTPEANHTDDAGRSLKNSGVGWARLLQIAPEVGFFVTDSLVLSLQGRFQIVTGASQVKLAACKGGTCEPSHYAMAGLAKATWFVGEPGTVSPFLSLAAGAGQIRHVVSVGNLAGCPPSGCKDTVVGGPVLVGPGAGITVDLSEHFTFVAGANVLVGVPKFMANLDVNLGLAYLR
jgi:hypothetical protein